MKVGFLTIAPSPYIQEMFGVLVRDGRIEPTVYYQESSSPAFDWRSARLPDYWVHLSSRTVSFMGARLFYSPSAIRDVSAQSFDAFVIGGYASLTSQQLMRWLNRQQIPWVFWGEIPGYQKRGLVGKFLRRVAMAPAIHGCHGVAAVGRRAADYYETAVGGRCPVANIPYYSDVSAFAATPRFVACQRDRPLNLLFCGQIVERKGVLVLLAAIRKLLSENPQCLHLTMLGRGELEETIRNMLSPEELNCISFEGFRQIDELPAYFAKADVFILPSLHDGWGVVINQALAAGLPIISTDAVGAALDLVTDGVNGRIVPAGNEEALLKALRQLMECPQVRLQMGTASRSVIDCWTPQVEANRWFELLYTVTNR